MAETTSLAVRRKPVASKAATRAFYLRLALANVRRSREIYTPYFLAVTILAGVYFTILALIYSPGLRNVPGGPTTQQVFLMAMVLFTAFVFFFMLYVHAFLMRRRKKEFALYSVLGMSRRHVTRILRWETCIVVGTGLLAGIALGAVLGRLLFMLLLTMMRAAAGGTVFTLTPLPFLLTGGLFLLIYIVAGLYSSFRLRLISTLEELKGEKKGEKNSRLVLPGAIIGLVLLGGSYWLANAMGNVAMAIGLFFPLAMVVIVATYFLFFSGSIALLRLLRANKRFYYKASHFITVSSMFHRMRQNARGLASICIFCTMLVMTIAGTGALYLGQEEMLQNQHTYDMSLGIHPNDGEEQIPEGRYTQASAILTQLAQQHGVRVHAEDDGRIKDITQGMPMDEPDSGKYLWRSPDITYQQYDNAIRLNTTLYFDVDGGNENALAFVEALPEALFAAGFTSISYRNVFSARIEYYGLFGGLLFLGVFFAILFLAMAVLMMYFKQITEGYEDKERFEIMQKVGMRDEEMKQTINSQILFVFFLPLMMTFCHALAANRIVADILEGFQMFNRSMTLYCILGTCVLFGVIYLFVYKQTAKVYYRIVKR